jgi:hypothetical protein
VVPGDGSRFLAYLGKAMISISKPWRVVQTANGLKESRIAIIRRAVPICTMRDETKIAFACLKHCAPGKKANRGDRDEPRLTAVTDGQARAVNQSSYKTMGATRSALGDGFQNKMMLLLTRDLLFQIRHGGS